MPKRRWLDKLRDDIKEGTVEGGSVQQNHIEVYIVKHRSHITVGLRLRG